MVRAPITLYRHGLGWVFGRRVLMLEHTGRRSGQARFVCLEVVERPGPDRVVIVSGFGERAEWYRNLHALAAAARPFLGQAGFTLIAVAAVVSTGSAINATLYGAAKFTYLMGRDGELPARFGRPVWNRPIGGLLATTAGTLVIVSTVNIEGISLMGSAGFLIIFAAVNLAADRLAGISGRARALALAGAVACAACLAGLTAYAAARIPAQLAVLGGLIVAAAAGEAIIRIRDARQLTPPDHPDRNSPSPAPVTATLTPDDGQATPGITTRRLRELPGPRS